MLSGLSAAETPEASGAFWRMSKAGEEGSNACDSVPSRFEVAAWGGAGGTLAGPGVRLFLGSGASMLHFPFRPKLQRDRRGGSTAGSVVGVGVLETDGCTGERGSEPRASRCVPSIEA